MPLPLHRWGEIWHEGGELQSERCDNNRQPEIAKWRPKPEVVISLELW